MPGYWNCEKCGKMQTDGKKRCGSCKAWRGGKRGAYKKNKAKANTNPKKNKNDKKSPKKRKGSAPPADLPQVPTPQRHNLSGTTPPHPLVGEVLVGVGAPNLRVSPLDAADDDDTVSTVNTQSSIMFRQPDQIRADGERADLEVGDGGDSDFEGEGADAMDGHSLATLETYRERLGEEIEVNVQDLEDNYTEGDERADFCPIEGAPPGWNPPMAPVGWTPPALPRGAPEHLDVDNPGNWSEYTFRARKKKKTNEFDAYEMPPGARPVPVGETGQRTIEGWVFHYDGWRLQDALPTDILPEDMRLESKYFREGNVFDAKDKDNPRRGMLDHDLLKKLGLTRGRMQGKDALFFYQLLLPFCIVEKSGIPDDPREDYYSYQTYFTNKYAIVDKQQGVNVGHTFKLTNNMEGVHFDGIGFRCKSENVHNCFCSDDDDYDELIANTMYHRRYIDLRSKLKCNDNSHCPPRGEPGHDPCAKYRLPWDVMTHNMNCLIKRASLDLTADETTCACMSYGGLALYRVSGKPGVTKGGQNVVLLDSHRRYIHAWIPRNSLNPRPSPFNQEGPAELKLLVDIIDPLVTGRQQPAEDKRRKLWSVPPHITFDNHFFGCHVMHYIGVRGYKATCTCRRDRFPSAVPKWYFHHKKQP